VIFLIQDVFEVAQECYPEEVGAKEISDKVGRPKDSINKTIRVFYNKKYQKCPERYPVTIEKKKIPITRTKNGKGIATVWKVKWRPSDGREM